MSEGAAPLDPARRSERVLSPGLVVSLLLHSLPLLALVGWHTSPQETSQQMPKTVPVEFVVEQPMPKPPAPPPQRIRAASADMAETAAPKPEPGAAAAAHEPAPAQPQTATAEPPPKPAPEPPAAKLVPPPQPPPPQEQAEPTPRSTETAALMPPPPPKPLPRKRQTAPVEPVRIASAWPLPLHREPERDRPHPAARTASLTGPAAVRDEYCVRALNMTLAHLDLVPRSFLAGRRGKTVLTIRILGDGTLNSVKLVQSSGFPDIDAKIEQMVFAVGAYPPLPPRLPGTWMDFTFLMVFPDAMQR